MEKLRNRMSYLNGMADGLGISSNSKEGRMVVEIMRVMEEMVSKMDSMDHRIDEQEEYLEAVDEDLADLEEFVEAIDEDLDDVESVLYWEDEDELEDNGIYFDDEDDEVIMVDGVYDDMEGYDDDDMGFFEVGMPELSRTCQYRPKTSSKMIWLLKFCVLTAMRSFLLTTT